MLFEYHNDAGVSFRRELLISACAHKQCTRNVLIGAPYCERHLSRALNLRIDTSTIRGAGLGVFAVSSAQDAQDENSEQPVFCPGDTVCTYVGEVMRMEELTERYGETTAPYAISIDDTWAIDAACYRGVGALINHAIATANTEFVTNVRERAVYIVATTFIYAGQELFANYGDEYFFNDAQFCTQIRDAAKSCASE